MRIAMVGQRTNLGSVGGVEGHVGMLGAALAELGHEVTVFSRPRYGEGPVADNVTVSGRPSIRGKHLETITHCTLAALEANLRRFDIVHFHGVGPALALPLMRFRGRTRLCVTVHDQDYNKDKWSAPARLALRTGERLACRYADEVIVVARYLQRHLDREYGRTSHYIPSGRESIETLPPGPVMEHFGLRAHRYLLFVGRLVPEKGCHVLLDAMAQSSTRHRLAVVGGDSHSARYVRALHARAAGDPRIIFPGPLSRGALAEVRSNAAAFVMPSLQEGLPLALLEALYAGLPVIATDIAASHEVIANGAGDRLTLVPPGDAAELRAAIDQLPYPAPPPQPGTLPWPTWEEVAVRVEAVYQRALAGSSVPRLDRATATASDAGADIAG